MLLPQAHPSLGLSILYGRQVSTYRTTPMPRITLWLSLCLVYYLDSPGSYSHVSLGVESFHVIARCDWTCSHTSVFDAVRILKGNILGYYHNLGSLRYGMSTVFLAVLRAALFQRNLRCGGEATAYAARFPAHFGMLCRAA